LAFCNKYLIVNNSSDRQHEMYKGQMYDVQFKGKPSGGFCIF
jgi:hypothetical protein